MEIIRKGTDDLQRLDVLSCCMPPGTESLAMPAE